MSLINEMLKDIDARQAGQRADAARARRLVAGGAATARRTNGWLLPLLGAIVVLLLAVVGWLLFNRSGAVTKTVPTAATPAAAAVARVAEAPVESAPPVAAAAPPTARTPSVSGAGNGPSTERVIDAAGPDRVAPVPIVAKAGPPPPPPAASKPPPSPPLPAKAAAAKPATTAASSRAAPTLVEKTSREPSSAQRAERLYREAYGLLFEGRSGGAEPLLREALQADARHRPARESLAGLLAATGRWVELRIVASEGLAADPGHGALAQLGARAALEQGDTAAAIAGLERAAATSPQEADFHALLAATYQQAGRFAESAGLYQRLLMANPQQATWWAGFAVALDGLGRAGEAREAFRNALARNGLTPQLQAYARERLGALDP